jgi:hypothetical protein
MIRGDLLSGCEAGGAVQGSLVHGFLVACGCGTSGLPGGVTGLRVSVGHV